MRLRNPGLLAALALALSTSVAAAAAFPATIALPRAFQPEGIAIRGSTFYVGSIPTGAIYRGNVRSGQGAVFIPGASGRAAIGVEIDNRNRLFVAGGTSGRAFVYDVRTRELIRSYQLTTSTPTFINDVVVTPRGAYFTDSRQARLYRVAIGRGGRLATSAQTIALAPPFRLQGLFNANGIDATPNGRWLVIVQSSTGKLYRVHPSTGATREISLGGPTVETGDGILLDGRTLYVVQNTMNQIAVIRVNGALTSGTIRTRITDRRFMVPTTIDEHGRRLYAVNAHFGATPSETDYEVLQLRKPPGS
jgi:sugar lactone lactonase YvrE